MPLAEVRCFSPTLSKMIALNVLLPGVGDGPWPVFYLLHGLSDDHSAWARRSRIEWYARDLPLIVVMPDGGRGFYTDNVEGAKYGTFFSEELIEFVERTFPARRDRAGRCVGGLSMGGYGAVRLALEFPRKFVSAHSHSGALTAWRYDANRTSLTTSEHRRIFGEESEGSRHDLFALAAAARAIGTLPALRIDCGTEDFLLPVNRLAHEEFTAMGIEHDYVEYPGAHDWDYWNAHIQDAIDFHLKHVARATRP
jgi:S-formylglutathione hydrolase FrmB